MSLCTRCGKQRIIVSSSEEIFFKSTVVFTETACPDAECQKEVEKSLKNEEMKRVMFKSDQEKKAMQRMALKKASI